MQTLLELSILLILYVYRAHQKKKINHVTHFLSDLFCFNVIDIHGNELKMILIRDEMKVLRQNYGRCDATKFLRSKSFVKLT